MSSKYEFIDGEKDCYPVVKMCRWARVSTSGFYEWRSRPASATADRRTVLAQQIRAVFASRAFNAVSDFADCEPIRPGQTDPDAPVPEAFISVPRALWNGSGLAAAVRAPAYSASAYHAPNLRKGTFSAADLTDLDGGVVLYQESYDESPRVGILSLDGESILIYFVISGAYGNSGSTPFTGAIGKAELIAGKRLGSRLRLSYLLGHMEPVLLGVAVDGGVATFRIAVPPGNTNLRALSEERLVGGALQVLLAPLLAGDEFAPQLDPSPLSWKVEQEVLRVFPAEDRQLSQYVDGRMIPAGDCFPHDMVQRLARLHRGRRGRLADAGPDWRR